MSRSGMLNFFHSIIHLFICQYLARHLANLNVTVYLSVPIKYSPLTLKKLSYKIGLGMKPKYVSIPLYLSIGIRLVTLIE